MICWEGPLHYLLMGGARALLGGASGLSLGGRGFSTPGERGLPSISWWEEPVQLNVGGEMERPQYSLWEGPVM